VVWLTDLITYTESPGQADLLNTERFPWKSLKKGTWLDSSPVVVGHVLEGASEFVQVRIGGSDALVELERLKEALPDWETAPEKNVRDLAMLRPDH